MDIWPLYLFHPGAVVVNIAVQIMTTCRILPNTTGVVELVSLDTGLADSFPSMEALRAALPSIRELPALLLWGDRDRAVAPSSAPPLQACFAHSRLVIVHDCGHLPYEECPARFNHELSEFLDSESPTL